MHNLFPIRFIAVGLMVTLLAACAHQIPTGLHYTSPCETEFASLDTDFSGGGMHGCKVLDEQTFLIYVSPEDEPPINPSPWYAFRLIPKQQSSITVKLRYAEYDHRYHPKLSNDLKSWRRLTTEELIRAKNTNAEVRLQLSEQPIYVSAQELLTTENYDNWMSKISGSTRAPITTIGKSAQGRDIKMLYSPASEQSKKTIVLVGRQHPPEVTGALAMRSFMTSLMRNQELANKFRAKFNIVAVPLMNPDGVELGHWRHNTGGLDLNRDWGPFTQPETQTIKNLLDELTENQGHQIVLFLDFHSTSRNVFYTQTKADESTAYDFTGNWLKNAGMRLPAYEFERAERHNSDLATSKNYMYSRFNIPAITYELGDETDRGQIQKSGQVFAEEMMKLLLTHESNE